MNETIKTTGRFACPLCPERFRKLGDKKQHMKDEHPRGKES